ncbi:MAG: glycosyltransferase [Acidimicrobiales bacterium]
MRVLHLIDSLGTGGAERSLAAMAPHLRDAGVDLEVAHLRSPDTLGPELAAAGIQVHDLRGSDSRPHQIERVRGLLQRRGTELLHTTLYRADVAGRPAAARAHIPSVTTWASTGPEDGGQLLRAKRIRTTLVDRHTARLAARFHAVSEPVAVAVGTRLSIASDLIDVIPRGRDPRRLGTRGTARSQSVRDAFGVGDAPMIVALARHEPPKGLDVLIDAMPNVLTRVPGARLLIAGANGSATTTIERAVANHDLGDAVALLGAVDDVGDLLAAADVCAVPSRVEGFPGVVVEAAMLGTPLVVSNIASVRAAIPDRRHAVLVTVNDPASLAQGIVDVLADPIAAADRAALARTHSLRESSLSTIVDATLAFYERALAARRVAA